MKLPPDIKHRIILFSIPTLIFTALGASILVVAHTNRTANPTPMTDGRYWVQCSSIEVWLEHHPGYVLHHGTYHNWIVKKAAP